MVEFGSATRPKLRRLSLTALIALAAVPLAEGPALAHHHHVRPQRARVSVVFHVRGHVPLVHLARGGGFTPPFSAYAVDGNSGRVLYGKDENALRHPASITKVMTLYLLFEQIERGRLSLDTQIEVSRHAAAQKPTKLGLRPGSTIRIEDAVKAIVTKSANDMAVAIAERIGGDEDSFARLMTRKAHALGMSRSNFVNASGLPDDRQLTTARDLAVLGRAIHDRYPQYFHFFSTPSFRYAGQFMPNHNHLMEQVEGMDGIKTGYTNASGFNLLSSVNRNGHWLISVVLGGKTRLGRDRIMADLIESEIDKCATRRTVPMIAENPDLEHMAEAVPVIAHEGDAAPPVEGVDDEAAEERPLPPVRPEIAARQALQDAPESAPAAQADENAEEAPVARPRPRPVRPVTQYQAKVASLAVDAPSPRPRPAFVSGVPKPAERDMTSTGSIHLRRDRLDGSTSRWTGAATATPSTFKHKPQRERAEVAKEQPKMVRVASLDSDAPAPIARSMVPHGGVLIQIGAAPSIEQAEALIARAKSHGGLGGARPFTEKVQKGAATLYRARFAGLGPDAADQVCKSLKRAGIACFTTKN